MVSYSSLARGRPRRRQINGGHRPPYKISAWMGE